jgi:predicted nicotinamide N-methyase
MEYQTEALSLNIEGVAFEIERITNIDALFNALIAKGEEHEDMKDERIPYWAELWHSALALSQYLIRSGITLKGKKILEIGAGLGLPSIVAGHLGAEVTVTDYLPEAVAFAEKNWKKNNTLNATFQVVDWRTPDESFAADIVLAADIAYEKRMFEFIPNAFKVLCKKNGFILLTEPNRGLAEVFLKELPQQGFLIEKEIIPISLFGTSHPINLLKIQVI